MHHLDDRVPHMSPALAAGDASCTYPCTTYGYAPGECSDGWYCWISDGCLTQSVCN